MIGSILHIEHVDGRPRAWLDGREIPGVAEVVSEHRRGNLPTARLELTVGEVRHGAPPAGLPVLVMPGAARATADRGARAAAAGRFQAVEPAGFSHALAWIKDGLKATRAGWNGPGQWVALSPGFQLEPSRVYSGPVRAAVEASDTLGNFSPYLLLANSSGDYVPWAPSQGDLLADDWSTVE